MRTCERCGSYAINPNNHGRDPKKDLNLCDVCYWRKRAEALQKKEDKTNAKKRESLRS